MSLETWLYIRRKQSKSRWPRPRLNGSFVSAVGTGASACANTGARICVHVTMETHLLLQQWGISVGPHSNIHGQEYSVSVGMFISQTLQLCDAAQLWESHGSVKLFICNTWINLWWKTLSESWCDLRRKTWCTITITSQYSNTAINDTLHLFKSIINNNLKLTNYFLTFFTLLFYKLLHAPLWVFLFMCIVHLSLKPVNLWYLTHTENLPVILGCQLLIT